MLKVTLSTVPSRALALTLQEFADHCDMFVTYVASECRAGRLPRVWDARWRRWMIDLEDPGVKKWLANPRRGQVSRYRKAHKEKEKESNSL